MPTEIERFSSTLRQRAGDFAVNLDEDDIDRLTSYYQLLLKWNLRLHLVAPCSPEVFAVRHVLESLVLLPHLSPNARVTDVGSGAGLPAIPCLIMRDDLRATLIESSQKKVVFLREAVRQLANQPQLIANRFEAITAPAADFVTCRALDRFQQMLPTLIEWAPQSSALLLFGGPTLREEIEALLPCGRAELIPGSKQRFLIIRRQGESSNQPTGS